MAFHICRCVCVYARQREREKTRGCGVCRMYICVVCAWIANDARQQRRLAARSFSASVLVVLLFPAARRAEREREETRGCREREGRASDTRGQDAAGLAEWQLAKFSDPQKTSGTGNKGSYYVSMRNWDFFGFTRRDFNKIYKEIWKRYVCHKVMILCAKDEGNHLIMFLMLVTWCRQYHA